jgi:SAM-dependent methyltransferase
MQAEQFHLNYDIELRHWWFVARRRILRGLLSQIVPTSPDTVVVDIGCGTGGNIGSLSDAYTCVGIDPSADALELAASRFPKVNFLRGLAPHDLGKWASRANVFLATDVLEHVPDDFKLLSELLAAARPGAYFLLTVPADMALWSPHDESHGHYRRYDLTRLTRLWAGLPVSMLLVSYFNSRLYPIVRLIRAVNHLRGKSSGDAGTDLKMPSAPVNRILDRIFSSEYQVLTDLLQGRRPDGYRNGVSLVAILRREQGLIVPRVRPADVPPDTHASWSVLSAEG